jgi:hypothetical protein
MASLVLTGDTSGQVTIAAPAVAGTTTLTLPATTGTVLADTTVGVCRAWVNFNGTGTVAIRASFNVTSITDIGTGIFAVNFTTAIVDANYSIAAISSTTTGNGATFTTVRETGIGGSNPSTTSFQLSIRASSFADLDVPYIYAQVFR